MTIFITAIITGIRLIHPHSLTAPLVTMLYLLAVFIKYHCDLVASDNSLTQATHTISNEPLTTQSVNQLLLSSSHFTTFGEEQLLKHGKTYSNKSCRAHLSQ